MSSIHTHDSVCLAMLDKYSFKKMRHSLSANRNERGILLVIIIIFLSGQSPEVCSLSGWSDGQSDDKCWWAFS